MTAAMRVLVIDVGGTHVKVLATGHTKWVVIPSGHRFSGWPSPMGQARQRINP